MEQGHFGVTAIADALSVNSSLNTLNLSDNKIGDKGVIAIAKALAVNCFHDGN